MTARSEEENGANRSSKLRYGWRDVAGAARRRFLEIMSRPVLRKIKSGGGEDREIEQREETGEREDMEREWERERERERIRFSPLVQKGLHVMRRQMQGVPSGLNNGPNGQAMSNAQATRNAQGMPNVQAIPNTPTTQTAPTAQAAPKQPFTNEQNEATPQADKMANLAMQDDVNVDCDDCDEEDHVPTPHYVHFHKKADGETTIVLERMPEVEQEVMHKQMGAQMKSQIKTQMRTMKQPRKLSHHFNFAHGDLDNNVVGTAGFGVGLAPGSASAALAGGVVKRHDNTGGGFIEGMREMDAEKTERAVETKANMTTNKMVKMASNKKHMNKEPAAFEKDMAELESQVDGWKKLEAVGESTAVQVDDLQQSMEEQIEHGRSISLAQLHLGSLGQKPPLLLQPRPQLLPGHATVGCCGDGEGGCCGDGEGGCCGDGEGGCCGGGDGDGGCCGGGDGDEDDGCCGAWRGGCCGGCCGECCGECGCDCGCGCACGCGASCSWSCTRDKDLRRRGR